MGKKLCISSCSVVVGIEPRDCYKPLLVLHFYKEKTLGNCISNFDLKKFRFKNSFIFPSVF